MILIAESGSTKTDWVYLGSEGNTIQLKSPGINPYYQNSKSIYESMLPVKELLNVQKIYFYGAGCANEEKNLIVQNALERIFPEAHCEINSDLLAAARSLCKNEQGIACILGTGSNSCFYNGKTIEQNISPLGYVLGDEGSGAVLGKKLIADILKNQAPQEIIEAFYEKYDICAAEIIHRVYKEQFPNRFLAKFAIFLSDKKDNDYVQELVISSFIEFFERNIKQYNNFEKFPVHFTGSIAYHFIKSLTKAAETIGVHLGEIKKSPLEGLIQFHTKQGQ